MESILRRVLVTFLAASLVMPNLLAGAKPNPYPVPIPGVWKKGHFLFEPRPKNSKFMQVKSGGFIAYPKFAAYYLELQLSPDLGTPYFMRATMENPSEPRKPLVEEATIEKSRRTSTIVSLPVKGLVINRNYDVKVEIFRKRGNKDAIDSLTQSVRSYVDTTGPEVKVSPRLRWGVEPSS